MRLITGVQDHLVAGSRIVVLGGHYGFEPSPAAPLAGMANAALGNFVRTLADRWGPHGVTVHLIAPGPVDTPRMRTVAERTACAYVATERRPTRCSTSTGRARPSAA